jgi:hypothetical protein
MRVCRAKGGYIGWVNLVTITSSCGELMLEALWATDLDFGLLATTATSKMRITNWQEFMLDSLDQIDFGAFNSFHEKADPCQ